MILSGPEPPSYIYSIYHRGLGRGIYHWRFLSIQVSCTGDVTGVLALEVQAYSSISTLAMNQHSIPSSGATRYSIGICGYGTEGVPVRVNVYSISIREYLEGGLAYGSYIYILYYQSQGSIGRSLQVCPPRCSYTSTLCPLLWNI